MNIKHIFSVCLTGFVMTTSVYAQTDKSSTDYLSVPGPISFEKTDYNLVWTSHPLDNYYKQEYIERGDSVEKFKTLILLDLITGNTKIKDVVAIKIAELKKLKKTNPVVQFEVFENKGEYMLDFLVSENTPDGKLVSIVERNVYRYKTIVDNSGKKGVLLFGVSERSYGDDIDNFFAKLKTNRDDLINEVGTFKIPDITIIK
ncbi:MAG TPA: hypothetical protein VIL78_01815 [Hanamia sp.]